MKHESACVSTLTTVADGFNFSGNLQSTFWLWVLTLNFLIAIKVFDGSIKVFEVFESFSNCGAKKIDKFFFFKFSQFKRILEPCINSFQIILEKRCFIRILKKKSIDKIFEDSNKHGWLCPLSVKLKYCSHDLWYLLHLLRLFWSTWPAVSPNLTQLPHYHLHLNLRHIFQIVASVANILLFASSHLQQNLFWKLSLGYIL